MMFNWRKSTLKQDSSNQQGPVEKLDDVEDVLVCLMKSNARAELQNTTRVGSNDGLRAGGLCVAHFLCKQLQGRFRLRDVVGSRRAAANLRVRQFHKIEIGNRA